MGAEVLMPGRVVEASPDSAAKACGVTESLLAGGAEGIGYLLWPRWQVPEDALGEWLQLQVALDHLEGPPACVVEPEVWWASRGTAASAADQAAAVEACGWCPVRVPCRVYALAAGERDGVWGGTTAEERRALGRAGRGR